MSTTAINQAQSPIGKFGWLVKREFWEYRGAFLRTPIIIASVMVAIMALVLMIAEVTAHRNGVNVSGVHLDELANNMSAAQLEKLHAGESIGLLFMCMPIGIGLFFVLFSYATGALYNDRADRSVLFWKSLPISDTQTVLAKVVTAMFVAPVLASAGMIALQLGFLFVMSLWALLHGISPLPLWSPTQLISLWVKMIVMIPLNHSGRCRRSVGCCWSRVSSAPNRFCGPCWSRWLRACWYRQPISRRSCRSPAVGSGTTWLAACCSASSPAAG